jgi:hypothetical protein
MCTSSTALSTVTDAFSIGTDTYASASAVINGPYYPPANSLGPRQLNGSVSGSINSTGGFSFNGSVASPGQGVYGLLFSWFDVYSNCTNGACACAAGYSLCGGHNGQCFNLSSDPKNCGACNYDCSVQVGAPNMICSNGQCRCPPAAPRLCCGNQCTSATSCPICP